MFFPDATYCGRIVNVSNSVKLQWRLIWHVGWGGRILADIICNRLHVSLIFKWHLHYTYYINTVGTEKA